MKLYYGPGARAPARLRPRGQVNRAAVVTSVVNAALHTARCFALMFGLGLLAACSTTRPWLNEPLLPSAQGESTPALKPTLTVGAPLGSPSVIAAVALSGGGARAAAFGLGVLQELKATASNCRAGRRRCWTKWA